MLKNYFVVALRSLRRRKGYAFVNLFGLGLACSVALLFGLLARDLLMFDRGYERADDVYLVLHDIVTSEGSRRVTNTWVPLWPAVQADLAGVEAGTRLLHQTHQVETGGSVFAAERVSYADAGYFRVFPFPFLRGTPETAFTEPDAVVLSATVAETYFGDADPIGQVLLVDGTRTLTVTGIVEPQRNHSASFEILAHWPHAEQHLAFVGGNADAWGTAFLETYLRLRPGTDPDAANALLAGVVAQHLSPDEARATLAPLAEWTSEEYSITIFATVFLLLALGVLLMAAANFTNLATARSLERAREIGVRKTLGAGRIELAMGFFLEAALVATGAVLLGLGLAEGAIPWVNDLLAGSSLRLGFDYGDPRLWAALGGLALLVTFLAGAYPAFFLTRFKLTRVLKGRLTAQPGGRRLRSGLVVFQFTLTVLLLSSALTIHRQVRHLGTFGFDFGSTPVVVVPLSPDAFPDREAGTSALHTLRDELRRHAAVAEASLSWSIPGAYYVTSTLHVKDADRRLDAQVTHVDPHYLDLYGIELAARQAPDAPASADSTRAVIVNQALLTAAGWDSFEGKTLHAGGGSTLEVVGVTEDFAYGSLRTPVGPAAHVLNPDVAFGFLSIRSATNDPGPILDVLNAQWPETGATRAFTSFFADEQYVEDVLGQETALQSLVGYAALFAALIALIGLAGIAALAAVQRTQEVSVRKVLGATTRQIMVLLTRQFVGLVLVAAFLALPLALFGMNAWLNQYAYRIAAGPGPALTVALAVLLVAASVVALQTLRTATADPARTLRHD